MDKKDYLWPQLVEIPYFRALLRAVEARFYQDIDLPSPTLDLGCGDGHFASHAFSVPPNVGVDPWVGPLNKAHKLGFYPIAIQGDGATLPFPDGYFASVVSNSVLEHIPELDQVLSETARVLCDDGLFVFCVPNHNFLPSLSIGRMFDRINLRGVGNLYRKFFNRISRHYHCDSPEVWEKRLEKAGFQIERWWHYFSPAALRVLEWGHYFGLPSAILHLFLRRWLLVSARWNLLVVERVLRKYYDEKTPQSQGAYSFYIARRTIHANSE